MPGQLGTYQDPYEKKIEDARKAGKILTPDDFKSKDMQAALYRLNMKNSTKNDSASDTAKKMQAETKAKPFVFKKGGMVKKSGIAKIHKGEKVLTVKQVKAEKKEDKAAKSAKKSTKKADVSSKITKQMASMY